MNILISYRVQLYKLKTPFFAFNLISGFYLCTGIFSQLVPLQSPSHPQCCLNITCDSRSFYPKILHQQHCVLCDDGGERMLRGTRAFVLLTLQSKQRVINILLIVLSRFSGCISLGLFFFSFFRSLRRLGAI